ncbi:MAG: response regulator [Suipraeoptans sp.]
MEKKERILVIDDDLTALKTISEMLSPNYSVSLADNGKKAARIIEKGTEIDIILLDIDMPNENGYEVIAKIKEIDDMKNVPVLFLTGLTDISSEVKGLELGAVDYIKKPVTKSLLLARLEVHLKLSRRIKTKGLLDPEKLMGLPEQLTNTELRTAELVVQGFSNEEIATKLHYSVSYVKQIVSRILTKLMISKRNEMKAYICD